jgi:hypothetical protein
MANAVLLCTEDLKALEKIDDEKADDKTRQNSVIGVFQMVVANK